jgi:hypothetical protein
MGGFVSVFQYSRSHKRGRRVARVSVNPRVLRVGVVNLMDRIATRPTTIPMLTGEALPVEIDIDTLVDVGEIPSNAAATLINLTTGAPYAAGLNGSPIFAGTTIQQKIHNLLQGTYRLLIEFDASSTAHFKVPLIIEVEY